MNSKDAFWFPHDAGARNDPKIVRLRRIHSHAGVGVYWYIIEMLREANSDDYEISLKSIEDIAYDGRFEASLFDSMFEIGLLQKNRKRFWSDSLKRRMKYFDDRRRKLSEAGKKGGRPRKEKSDDKARLKGGFTDDKGKSKPLESKDRTGQDITDIDPPLPPKGFELFWASYPKKVGKQAALKAWKRAIKKTDTPTIIKAIEAQKQSGQWKKSNGQYIPNPSTWLNQGRWEDEISDVGFKKSGFEAWGRILKKMSENEATENKITLTALEKKAMENTFRSLYDLKRSSTKQLGIHRDAFVRAFEELQ